MNNWWRLFLSTKGAINRRTFWHGVLVVTALNITLLGSGFSLQTAIWGSHNKTPINLTGKFQFGDLLCLLTFWFTICVFTKRLRSLRVSAWVQAPSRLLVAWGVVCLAVATVWSGDFLALVLGLGDVGLLLGLAIDLGLIIWMGTANPKDESLILSEGALSSSN